MKKIILFILTIMLLSGCLDLSQPSKDMQLWVGEKIVIYKDTLVIIGFSSLGHNVHLHNGTQVSYEFAKKYFDSRK